MTKDVNRELMDEINQKEYIISECRKMYNSLTNTKNTVQHRNLKNLLNIKGWLINIRIFHYLLLITS